MEEVIPSILSTGVCDVKCFNGVRPELVFVGTVCGYELVRHRRRSFRDRSRRYHKNLPGILLLLGLSLVGIESISSSSISILILS